MSLNHLTAARQLVACKAPFLHQGRSDEGTDCAGVAVMAARADGIEFEDLQAYAAEPSNDKLRQIVRKNFGLPRVDKRNMQVGDLAIIAFHRAPHHIALIGDYLYGGFSLIHSYSGGPGHVTEHRLDDRWFKMIVEVYPWPV